MLLTQEKVLHYRSETFYTQPGRRLKTVDEAVDFVNKRGFIFFWPVKNIVMPSLWAAVAGDRPVPDEHDDPGHITWDWKDRMLGKHRWYYGRVLRKRNTIISMDLLPNFYALSPNYGDPDEDYLIDYEQGRLTQGAKQLYEALLNEGPQDTIALRKAARLTNSNSEFNHALDELQTTFRVLPVGVSQAGAWHYAFIYDIVTHHLPDLSEQAHPISEYQARRTLITTYLDSVGAAQMRDLTRLFGWQPPILERELNKLEEQGQLHSGVTIDGLKGEWFVSTKLCSNGWGSRGG